jgi:hypothetical protein
MEDEPKKGEFNKRFGLYVDRTFFIVSHLDEGRYIDYISTNQLLLKTPNGR